LRILSLKILYLKSNTEILVLEELKMKEKQNSDEEVQKRHTFTEIINE
jgi:hypothetical protein